MKHIRIEEENRSHENKNDSEFGSKVNNIESNTKKSTKIGNNSENKRKYADSLSNNSANFKKNKTCFFCGKNCHFKKEFRFYKRLKKEANTVQEKANSPSEIIAMIVELKISMITECNMATTYKIADWWYDSGARVHVCNDKNLFKNYKFASNDGKS